MPTSTAGRRRLIALSATLAVLTAIPSAARAAGPARTLPGSPAAAARSGVAHTVTLITGDRVTVTPLADGRSAATVKRPNGLTGGVLTETVGKDLYVYPAEAMSYVASGALDRRLFDVSLLIADGYDDAHGAKLPLIVQYTRCSTRGTAQAAPRGLTAGTALTAINGTAATVTRSTDATLWKDLAPAGGTAFSAGISRIWLDGKVRATLADSTKQIGAPQAWAAGVDGKGVNVAILDTGADTAHPDLVGRIAGSRSFVPGQDVTDRNGHGTHTASTIAGTGAASKGLEKGVAPAAQLLVGKVLSNEGEGDESWIIAGMQWAAQTEHARVISMSLGSTEASDGTDPMSQAVNDLSAATGALFVIAAGNSGPGGIGAPGAATAALTVGAVDSADQLAYFSSYGPRSGDGGLKPEITGPGVDILAARSQYSAEGSGYYTTMSGTSMATPHVAGAAALLAEQHPGWTGQQLKDALVSTSKETPDIPLTLGGAGRVDLSTAAFGTVDASATAWSGFYSWPHGADRPATRTVTYSNSGSAAVTLGLAAKATAPDGGPAAAGVFTLSARTVTVPAHGTAQVTVTGDPNAAGYGVTDGQIEAADATGTVLAHTLIGIDREEERYNLSINATDRAGRPLSGSAVLLRTGDTDAVPVQIPASGKLSLRLPRGEYALVMYADLPGAAGPDDLGLGLLSVPQINLDRSRTATLDARRAHRVSAVVPQAATDRELRVEWNRKTSDGGVLNGNFLVPVGYTSVWAQSTAPVTSGSFNFDTRWSKGAPPLTLTATGSGLNAGSLPDASAQQGSTALPAGTSRLSVVDAGKGGTADYAALKGRAKGRAVLVRHLTGASRAETDAASTAQAAAAVAAGAKLLLVADDAPGRLSGWYGTADYSANSPIPVVGLRSAEGAALIRAAARGAVGLTVAATPNSPYVYDLVERHDGAIPAADLTYRPKPGELARIDQRFGGRASSPGYQGRYDMQDFDQYGVGFDLTQAPAATRTDWVTPGDRKFGWYEQAGVLDLVEERALITDYARGSRTAAAWFTPVLHPRLNTSTTLPDRQGDFVSLNVPAWGDGSAGHDGYDLNLWGTGDQLHETVTLYQGGTRLGSTVYQQLNLDLPSSEVLPYRLVAETSQSAVFPTSPATRTEWNFRSGNGYVFLPLIQLDYGVATDLAGDAARNTVLTLTASQLPGVTGAGTITGATLQVSFNDGSDWTTVTLHHLKGTVWTADVKAPKGARYVSLRATSQDDRHNTVSQTVLRAYGVK